MTGEGWLGRRYVGTDQAEQFGKRNAVPGEVLVRLTPPKVTAWAQITD
jgi:hypothetical protein